MKTKQIFLAALTAGLVILCYGTAMAIEVNDIAIHGFISQGYLKSSDNNYLSANTEDGSFEFSRMGLNFSMEPYEKLRIGMQLFSRDLGTEGNNDIVLDWAYLDYRWKDYLGIRAGRIKTPYGLYNEGRDMDFLRTSILPPQSVYPENMRDLLVAIQGACLYGTIELGALGGLDYQAIGGTINVDGSAPFYSDLFNRATVGTPFYGAPIAGLTANMDYMVGGSLQWKTPLDGLRLGVSDLVNKIDNTATAGGLKVLADMKVKRWSVFSAEYLRGNLAIAGEYFRGKIDLDVSAPAVGMALPIDMDMEGYYGQISYRFNKWLELGAYYSEFYPNADDKDGNGWKAVGQPDFLAWQKDWTLSARFDLLERLVLKFETHFIDGAGQLSAADNPDGLEKSWTLYAVQCSYNF